MTRHFLNLLDATKDELALIIRRASQLRQMQKAGELYQPFVGRTMAMIFEKHSTRTRVSFEAGMGQFGGHALFLSPSAIQLGRGEPIEDSARVISSIVDIVVMRTFGHDRICNFAKYSSVPVINALTDEYHPCQLLSDIQTFNEHRGSIAGKTVTWVGDGNNMCSSYILAAEQFDFYLNIASPDGYKPNADLLNRYKHRVQLIDKPAEAVKGASLVVTDVWASMGQEQEQQKRLRDFAGYQVDEKLLDLAQPDVLFMHCLPAHRGEEISTSLLDDPRSVVWDEAENRLHAQKALVEFLLQDKIRT